MKTISIKEYAGCIIPLLLIIGLIVYLFYSNNQKNEDSQKSVVGKYVYLDTENTLHVRRNCHAIGKQPGELGSTDRTVSRVEIEDVTSDMIEYTCSRCVTDEIYEELKDFVNNTE